MKISKKLFILIFCLTFSISNLPAHAFVGDLADSAINFTAKTVYFATKYSLKTAIFIIEKTAKGLKVVSINIYTASKDAFISPSELNSSNTYPVKNLKSIQVNSLPTVPSAEDLPPLPDNLLPLIKY
jgi:hypothetical protein